MHDNTFDASGAVNGDNAVFLDQVSSDAQYYFPGYTGDGDGEFTLGAGNASADLDTFFTANGNDMTNGGGAFFGGGVDAGVIMGATGDPLVHPPYFP
jgi:hypothetical protein